VDSRVWLSEPGAYGQPGLPIRASSTPATICLAGTGSLGKAKAVTREAGAAPAAAAFLKDSNRQPKKHKRSNRTTP
jgi:hypothetical protein